MQKKDLAPLPAPVSKSSRGSLSRPLKKMLLNPSGKLLTSVSVQRSAFWCLRTFKTRENDRFFLQENGMIFVVWSSFGPYEQLPSCTDPPPKLSGRFRLDTKTKTNIFFQSCAPHKTHYCKNKVQPDCVRSPTWTARSSVQASPTNAVNCSVSWRPPGVKSPTRKKKTL